MISFTIVVVIHSQQVFHFKQVSNLSHSAFIKLTVSLSFLSLGGLPPFLGFLPKLTIIQALVYRKDLLWLAFLLFSALITLFYYLRLIILSFTLASPKTKKSIVTPTVSLLRAARFINLVPLLTPLITFNPF